MATLKKVTFQNGKSGETPVNANNLNVVQNNVETFGKDIITETTALITTLETRVGDISSVLDEINGEVV